MGADIVEKRTFGLNALDEDQCERGKPLSSMFTAQEAKLIKRFINSFRVRMWEGKYPFVDRDDPEGEYTIYLPHAEGGSMITAFEVISVGDDALTCARVASIDEDGWPVAVEVAEEAEEETVAVMKPWILRRTPFDGEEVDGITYTYTSATEREATDDPEADPPDAEEQIVTPVYLVRTGERAGELVYAVESLEGWVDINHAGRCWAAIEPVEEPE